MIWILTTTDGTEYEGNDVGNAPGGGIALQRSSGAVVYVAWDELRSLVRA